MCGLDFGHNVVIPPLPIPEFVGHFTPPTDRVQRIRVRLGKQGDMRLISHLDWLRLLDRVVRRAAIPIAFTGGFHPSPRIVPANALSLGATSSGEIVDFELTRQIDPAQFHQLLAYHLPSDMPVYAVEEVDLKTPSATQLLEQAEYHLTVTTSDETDPPSPNDWQTWIDKILASSEIWTEQTTKSGKVHSVNLRDRLSSLTLVSADHHPPSTIHHSPTLHPPTLNYIGSCRNDGTMLRPEHLITMLEQVAGREFRLLHSHRDRLILGSTVTAGSAEASD